MNVSPIAVIIKALLPDRTLRMFALVKKNSCVTERYTTITRRAARAPPKPRKRWSRLPATRVRVVDGGGVPAGAISGSASSVGSDMLDSCDVFGDGQLVELVGWLVGHDAAAEHHEDP